MSLIRNKTVSAAATGGGWRRGTVGSSSTEAMPRPPPTKPLPVVPDDDNKDNDKNNDKNDEGDEDDEAEVVRW